MQQQKPGIMKKIILTVTAALAIAACSDKKTETEETVITTKTTTDPDAGPEGASSTVTRTVETDTSKVEIKVENVDLKGIDTTDSNRRRQ